MYKYEYYVFANWAFNLDVMDEEKRKEIKAVMILSLL